MERDRKIELVVEVAGLGLLAIAALGAFSRPVRQRIKERDGHRSVLSGQTEKLEVAHIDHSKKNPRYNDESNGRTLTTAEHYLDHYNRHGRNGLTTAGNRWSLRKIWERLTDTERERLPPPPTE